MKQATAEANAMWRKLQAAIVADDLLELLRGRSDVSARRVLRRLRHALNAARVSEKLSDDLRAARRAVSARPDARPGALGPVCLEMARQTRGQREG